MNRSLIVFIVLLLVLVVVASANAATDDDQVQRAALMALSNSTDGANFIMHHEQDPVLTSYDWTGRLIV